MMRRMILPMRSPKLSTSIRMSSGSSLNPITTTFARSPSATSYPYIPVPRSTTRNGATSNNHQTISDSDLLKILANLQGGFMKQYLALVALASLLRRCRTDAPFVLPTGN